jgi:hypothetical protein
MSVSANPITRSLGRALVVASPQGRSALVSLVSRFGFECAQADDPYAAMSELCRRPLVYRALIVGLQGLYREELSLISSARHRFPHLDILLTQTDGRQSALADALRLGADGLIDAEGIHRTAAGPTAAMVTRSTEARVTTPEPRAVPKDPRLGEPRSSYGEPETSGDRDAGEPVLTADELRALLSDASPMSSDDDEERRR